jgi:alpha-D-xyloside xylohydrolase
MKKLSILTFLLIGIINFMMSEQYQRTSLGVKASIQSMDVELQFYSPSIVRVIKNAESFSFQKQSISVNKSPEVTDFQLSELNNQTIKLSTQALDVTLSLLTGKVCFFDKTGRQLLTEKDYGTQFTPVVDVKKATYLVRQAFLLDKDEAIYGLGQQQNGKLMQRNQRVILKNDNMKVCFPYFLSLKGYGIFWDNYASTTFTDNVQETSFESLGDCSDYYLMYGENPTGVIASVRSLTGQAPMWPLWSFGYWQSRERYKTQQELMDVVAKYRTLRIPLDGIIQDWQYWGKDSLWNRMEWESKTHPDPKAMADFVHQNNAHLMVVTWPGFGPLTKQYKEFKDKKMLIDFDTWPPKSGVKPYDVYNPEARNIFWNYLNKGVFSIGTDAWWLDSTEPDHINIKESDFDQPTFQGSYRSVVNAFPIKHVGGIYEHQRQTTSDKRVVILTRSAFMGQQRYAANTWSGDVQSSWEALQKQVPAALNFSLGGIPYWNADIGGFFAGRWNRDGGAKNPEFQELYLRWMQFAIFTPMMRSHGTDIPREIYQFGDKGSWIFDGIEKQIKLRYHLLPYLYANARKVSDESASFMYALPLIFPEDKNVRDITDEYMFGDALLVAPVLNAMYTGKKDGKVYADFQQIKTRKIYLPEGKDWYEFVTGKKLAGGQTLDYNAPVDVIPLFVKSGSIIPFGPDVQYATEKKWDKLDIKIYPGADAEFVLYEDENDNYNYEKGAFSTIRFQWNDEKKTLTIGERRGNFNGMLKKRNFRITLNGSGSKNVSYSGKNKLIKF